MTYRKKAAVLSVLVIVLALVYILTLVFDPGNRRSAAFAWLDPSLLVMADRIEIYGPGGRTSLSRKNNVWVFSTGIADYPARQGRVEDLLLALSRRGVYMLRAASLEGRERLGLAEESASRILVLGGAGLPLLDLFVGGGDALGREVYLRMAGRNEIYSGEDRFTLYTDSRRGSWYDLRLFPQEARGIDPGMVQQAEIILPGNESAYVLRRGGGGWVILGNESAGLDNPRVDSWLRSVLEAEGEDFSAEAPASFEGSVILYLGDGTTRAIQAGAADGQQRRSALVSGSSLVFVLAEWTVNRLFRESSYFLKASQ